jgi:molybdopterin synthase catalytic subunit
MQIQVKLTTQGIARDEYLPGDKAAGAVVEFTGVVRDQEDGVTILGLEYEAYEKMAIETMNRILQELGRVHGCLSACVVHRTGFIPAGEAAIYAVVTAPHRREAFALMTGFIDRLKEDVPIWKVRAVRAVNQPEVKQ